MITHLINSEIDKDKWDNCILNSINGITYAYSWYLDIVHEDWEALVENDYERVMPLTINTKYGISYFFQPFFTQQLGVFSVSNLSPQIIDNFIQNIPAKVKVIDYNFNHFNTLDTSKYEVVENTNYLLDLISDYSKLKASYSTNTKRNLKKAESENLTFMKSIKPEDIIELFRNNKGAEIDTWDDTNYLVLRRLMYAAIHKGMGVTFGVFSEFNELCAAAFFIKTNSRLIFLFSGSNDLARANGAMTYLIDSVIKINSPGTQILDFEGSNNENLARYYKGFGASRVAYHRLKINRLSVVQKILMNIYNTVNRK